MPTLTLKISPSGTTYDSTGKSLASHIWFFILWGLLVCLSGCSLLDITPTPPIKIPIDLSKAGSVVETEFRIAQDDRIKLGLYFFINDKPGDRERLLRLVLKSGASEILIPLKIKINKHTTAGKDEVLVEQIYLNNSLKAEGFTSKYFVRTIDRLNISSGTYRLRLETMESFPQLADTPVEFRIYYVRAPK